MRIWYSWDWDTRRSWLEFVLHSSSFFCPREWIRTKRPSFSWINKLSLISKSTCCHVSVTKTTRFASSERDTLSSTDVTFLRKPPARASFTKITLKPTFVAFVRSKWMLLSFLFFFFFFSEKPDFVRTWDGTCVHRERILFNFYFTGLFQCSKRCYMRNRAILATLMVSRGFNSFE